MFHFDGGLKLTRADLAVDIPRRQPRGFVSHAHFDHMARHALALCTPATARLYQMRLGKRDVFEIPYGQPIDWGGLRLTTYPAGHCLGSAMLLADDGEQSLLYTGDFKLDESATAERAELPKADILVMESTYGHPDYRLAPRAETVARLVALVRATLDAGRTPVVQAYSVGKAQEVTRLLTDAGIAVVQHSAVYAASRVYEACGVSLGAYRKLDGVVEPHEAVVVPTAGNRSSIPACVRRPVTFAVSGWAVASRTRRWFNVDHAIPLSDHADFDQLLQAVDQVQPREVYCTHGPESFVDILRQRGVNAFRLGDHAPRQRQRLLPFGNA